MRKNDTAHVESLDAKARTLRSGAVSIFASLLLVTAISLGVTACASATRPQAAPSDQSRAKAEESAPTSQPKSAGAAAPSPMLVREVRSSPAQVSSAAAATSATATGSEGAASGGAGAANEEYAAIVENTFKKTSEDGVSTFGVDVDTASYANVRRYLKGGSLPPPDAVRIEEIVNYFDYGWKAPATGAPIAVTTETADCPWTRGNRLLAIGLRTRGVSADNLPPANLVFLVDTSGSMGEPDKLPLVKRAFSLLAETMRAQDRVALVAYAGSAGLVLPPTQGSDKAKILAALEELGAGGSTAGGQGIALAYETALAGFRKGGNNRVILATDGDFNVGPSSEEALVKLVESYRDKGVFLSIIGVGTGNLKDSRMKAIAGKGNGNYGYVDTIAEARRMLVEEMGATLLTVAKDVKIQVEFDPAVVESWRLIGYESRILAAEDFADDKKDSGEMGAGHRVTALYEIEPSQTASAPAATAPGRLRLRYKKPDAAESELMEFVLSGGGGSLATASEDLRFASAAAAYGMLLKGSRYKGRADWPMVLELAKGASAKDQSGRRAEFIALAEKAASLSKKQ